MAFCPHCGQRTGDQATKCVACGKQIKAPSAATGPAKFKGTMMMAAPNTKEAIAAAPPGSLARASQSPATSAVNAGASEKPVTPRSTKKALSGTMVGGMVAPELLAPKPALKSVAPATSAPSTAPSIRPASSSAPGQGQADATAATDPPASAQHPGVRHKASAAAVTDTVVDSGGRTPSATQPNPQPATEPEDYPEEISKVLPGDPMAAFEAQGGPPQPSPSSPRVPLLAEHPTPHVLTTSHSMDSASGKLWLAVGFAGMLGIAGLGALAAKFMGLM